MKKINYKRAAITVFAILVIAEIYIIHTLPRWSELPDMRERMERLRQTPRSDVLSIWISSNNDWWLTLNRPKDDRYINELLGSLRRMTVEDTGCGPRNGDLIVVTVKKHPINWQLRIEGEFKPGDRIVSPYLRSDDLGKIVYDIYKHKGIKPRKE